MGRYSGKTCRLLSMLSLTFSFFVTELVVGYATNSMALIADSFHMLSDVLALVIAFVSIKMAPKEWSKNTFGWARAEVLGALVNSVFLLALCFSIFVEALNRLYDPTMLRNPILILIVGALGLIVNFIGLLLFARHGHGHGHSHGGHGHAQSNKEQFLHAQHQDPRTLKGSPALEGPPPRDCELGEATVGDAAEQKTMSSSQMNMRGVFLHVLSDAIGSVIVIISALIVWLTDWKYSIYIDPALSLCLVLLISITTWPLLRDSALILLQTVPTHIKVAGLEEQLRNVEGVAAVHEFHVWQLAGDRIIASAHIRFRSRRDYMTIAEEIKTMFHQEGIHSTTIQPEFDDNRLQEADDSPLLREVSPAEGCILDCPSSERKMCAVNTCCGVPKKKSSFPSSPSSFAYDNAVALEEAAAERRASGEGGAASSGSCCSSGGRGSQTGNSPEASRTNSMGHSSIYHVKL